MVVEVVVDEVVVVGGTVVEVVVDEVVVVGGTVVDVVVVVVGGTVDVVVVGATVVDVVEVVVVVGGTVDVVVVVVVVVEVVVVVGGTVDVVVVVSGTVVDVVEVVDVEVVEVLVVDVVEVVDVLVVDVEVVGEVLVVDVEVVDVGPTGTEVDGVVEAGTVVAGPEGSPQAAKEEASSSSAATPGARRRGAGRGPAAMRTPTSVCAVPVSSLHPGLGATGQRGSSRIICSPATPCKRQPGRRWCPARRAGDRTAVRSRRCSRPAPRPALAPMIGLFDSGVGGLSVLREVRGLLPAADLVYLADQAHNPYGERSLDDVRDLAGRAATHLISRGAATVVVACNTASAAALRVLRAAHPSVPFVGMEPAVKPAAAATRSGVVGVLATPTTFQAEVFDDLVGRFAAGIDVRAHPCPGWADLVERDGGDADPGVIARHVRPVVEAGADTLVLACTHYAFIAAQIAEAAGPGVTLIDPAEAVARQVARVAGGSGSGTTTYLTTGDPDRFSGQIRALLGTEAEASTVTI